MADKPSSLAMFLRAAEENTRSTFVRLPAFVDLLVRVNDTFERATAAIAGTSDRTIYFVLGAQSSYLAGVRLAMSCHSIECYKCARACLETAHYGLLVHRKPEAWTLWHDRHADEKSRKAVGRTFSVTNINRNHLQPRDGQLAEIALDLHERSIDFGAHFNVMAWGAAFKIVDREAGLAEMQVLTSDEREIKLSLHFLAMTAVAALRVLALAFEAEFRSAGLDTDLRALSLACSDLFVAEIDFVAE